MRQMARTLLLVPGAAPVTAWAQGPGPMHDWMGWGWGGMIFGPLFMIVWVALLVALVVLVVRWLSGSSFGIGGARPSPREILDERFAKGEIDQEEYERRRKALGV